MSDVAKELEELNRQIAVCQRCQLGQMRTRAVPGEGPPDARIMFIGEAPGFHEDRQGRPFVGAAGKFLDELLASIELKREDVFIANVIKCFISPRVLIYTSGGYKPIKDIQIGDLVLTHSGRFRKVVYIRPHEILPAGSELVRITVRAQDTGNHKPTHVTVTPEHPFLVNGEWKSARDIRPGDRIRALGDRCEVCGRPFYVRYDRYDVRTYRTCSPKCHNKRVMHSPETRQKIREIMNEYVFVDIAVTQVEHRKAGRNFPLYNIGVEDDESYVAAGIVSHNCRPPGNRDPRPDEIGACRPYLDRQIELIRPRIIVTLGRFSMARYFPGASISRIHGQHKRVGGMIYYPMFHPAAALHQPRWRPLIEEDMKRIPELLAQLEDVEAEPPEPEESYEQLSLF